VPGKCLRSLLAESCIGEIDLLLLNCEGAELHALRELAEDTELRVRVRQICTSFHCDHCATYPAEERDKLLAALLPYYGYQVGTQSIPYYLFTRT